MRIDVKYEIVKAISILHLFLWKTDREGII